MAVVKEPGFYISEPGLPFTAYLYTEEGANQHWHQYWEMICQIEGETQIRIGNDDFISKVGEINIIGSEELHSTKRISAKHKLLLIQFEASAILPYLASFNGLKHISSALLYELGYKKHFNIVDKNQHVHQIMEVILKEYSNKELGYELEVQSQLMHLFSFFIRNKYIDIPMVPDDKKNALTRLKPVLLYIENNFHHTIPLKYIAEMACMSPYNLCRVFKKATDKTFTEYINLIRLIEAERRIVSTTDTITSISLDIGFSSVNYFNRLFKEKNNMSPQVFRKQYSAIFEQKLSRMRT